MEQGAKDLQRLQEGGFTSEEISEYQNDISKKLTDGGFNQKEIKTYWGIIEPDTKPIKNYIEDNFKQDQEKNKDNKGPKKAEGIIETIEVGWQISVAGLLARQKLPELTLPEDASLGTNILAATANFIGDIPAIVSGGLVGSMGGPLGAGAGAVGAATAIREILMDNYANGSMHSFNDLWTRGSGILLDTVKSATVGATTAGIGGVVGRIASPLLSPVALSVTKIATEAATMTTVGAALDGEIPKAKHFVEAAVFITGLHGIQALPKVINKKNINTVNERLRNLYSKDNITPQETIERVTSDRVALEDLASDNGPIAEREYIEKLDKKQKIAEEKITKGISREKEAAKERPKEIQDIMDRISTTEKEPKTLKDTVEGSKTFLNKFYINAIDNINALDTLVKELNPDVPDFENPYTLARLTRGVRAKAEYFLTESSFSNTTSKDTGLSLKDIIKDIKNPKEFEAYLVSEHALEIQTETGLNLDSAKKTVELLKDKYGEKAVQFSNYRENLLRVLKDSEIISDESFDRMTAKYKSYVPLKRILGTDNEITQHFAISSDDLKVKTPIKGRKGSEKIIQSPLESTIKDAYNFIALADKNKAVSSLVNFLKENAVKIDPKTGEKYSEIFKPIEEKRQTLNKNEIAVFEKGERKIYELRPDLAEAVNGIEQEAIPSYLKWLGTFKKIKRYGIVASPAFAASNFVKDLIAAPILSKSGFVFLKDTIGGMTSLLKKDEYWREWMKSGGGQATISSMDTEYFKDNIFDLDKKTGIISSGINVIKKPFEMMEVFNKMVEEGPRVGEFKKALEKGEGISEAAFRSRDITVDYAKHGAKTQALRFTIAFWNAHVQGVDKALRSWKEDPISFSKKAFVGITLPSVLMYLINRDNPHYRDLTNQERDLYWWFFVGDYGFKIPKPFEPGLIYGALPERMMGSFEKDNPEAFKDFYDGTLNAFTPSIIPTGLAPIVEAKTGVSLFTGNRIVPGRMEKLFSDLQYTPYTSELAKNFSKALVYIPGVRSKEWASPVMIEHMVNAWTGNVGTFWMNTLDEALIKSGVQEPKFTQPTRHWMELPFIRSFVKRFPSMRSQSIENFYENFDKTQRVFNSLRTLAQRGDFDSLRKEAELQENQVNMVRLNNYNTAISTWRSLSVKISLNKDMNPDDKRKNLDKLTSMMVLTAQQANKMMNQVQIIIESKND